MTRSQVVNADGAGICWTYPDPFTIDVEVGEGDTDRMRHTNNVAYLAWLERVAWAHSEWVGLDWAAYRRLGVACVARRTELDYVAPSFPGDRVRIATWIIRNDGRLRVTRAYQAARLGDGRTLLHARTQWVSVALDSGRPCRMPAAFVSNYAVTATQSHRQDP